MSAISDPSGEALKVRAKNLLNVELKRICKEEGKVQSGNKSQLTTRIIAIIDEAVQNRDNDTLERMRYRVNNHGAAPPAGTITSNTPNLPDPFNLPGGAVGAPNGMQNGYRFPSYRPASTQQSTHGQDGDLTIFKPSPFYELQELLLKDVVLEASPSHRQSATRFLQLDDRRCERMRSDPTLKILLYSRLESSLPLAHHDVAFPSQIEVKINRDAVSANFKGLKNKTGSTRPADITDYLRKSPSMYKNEIAITYALTQKVNKAEKFHLYFFLAKKRTVEDLAKDIKQRVITKQSVLDEMRRKASDPDIEVGSINMGLKDPVSTLRISIPCRSTVCSHFQCFDAASFLQLQEQAPTWSCPICNKTVSFEALAVDQYVQEILDTVPKSTDQVTIEPNGKWSYGNTDRDDTPRTNGFDAANDYSDDDLIDLTDHRITAIKSEAMPTPQSLARTPPVSSREASSAPRSGNKRKAEVIDLTLDDDDEPERPAKKVAYHTPSSIPDPSRRYQVPTFGTASVPMRPQPHHSHSIPTSSSLRLNQSHALTSQSPPENPYGLYRPPPPSHPGYPGQGNPQYGGYLGSSP